MHENAQGAVVDDKRTGVTDRAEHLAEISFGETRGESPGQVSARCRSIAGKSRMRFHTPDLTADRRVKSRRYEIVEKTCQATVVNALLTDSNYIGGKKNSMSDLAYNLAGEPFEVPNMAGGWRVRKLKPKGAPEVVYGREGIPLILPIDADMDALRHEARTEGRYRLDPVDEHNRMIPNATAAYVCIHASESPAAPPPTARPVSPSTDHAVI